MTRFAMYETMKKRLTQDGGNMPFYQKVLTAAVSGATGGFVGTPADLVNVRLEIRTLASLTGRFLCCSIKSFKQF
jgi:dicarboxylate transporter 10